MLELFDIVNESRRLRIASVLYSYSDFSLHTFLLSFTRFLARISFFLSPFLHLPLFLAPQLCRISDQPKFWLWRRNDMQMEPLLVTLPIAGGGRPSLITHGPDRKMTINSGKRAFLAQDLWISEVNGYFAPSNPLIYTARFGSSIR